MRPYATFWVLQTLGSLTLVGVWWAVAVALFRLTTPPWVRLVAVLLACTSFTLLAGEVATVVSGGLPFLGKECWFQGAWVFLLCMLGVQPCKRRPLSLSGTLSGALLFFFQAWLPGLMMLTVVPPFSKKRALLWFFGAVFVASVVFQEEGGALLLSSRLGWLGLSIDSTTLLGHWGTDAAVVLSTAMVAVCSLARTSSDSP